LRHGQGNRSTMTNTMKSNLLDMVQNIVQMDRWYSNPNIDESYRVIRDQLETFRLR
jgi:hypothetical protein